MLLATLSCWSCAISSVCSPEVVAHGFSVGTGSCLRRRQGYCHATGGDASPSPRRPCSVGTVNSCSARGPTEEGGDRVDRESRRTRRRSSFGCGKENPRWGYLRIQGELRKLGVSVSATAFRSLLRRHGLPPAPRR